MPSNAFSILYDNLKNGTYSLDLTNYSNMIIYKFRNMTVKEIGNLPDVSEGLEYLIKDAVGKTNNIVELINLIKNKRYTQTRIQRILVYGLLGITKKDMEMSKKVTPYVRVLGCTENGKKLLAKIKSKNVITSVKKFENKNKNIKLKRMLEIDKMASDIYTIAYKNNSACSLDYIKGLIITK